MENVLHIPKLITRHTAAAMSVKARSQGQRVIFTNGCFDVLHAGHVYLLEEAAKLGEVLIIGLNDDASVTRLKGPSRPKFPLDLRAYTLAGLSAVDYIVPFNEDTPLELINMISPYILVKGGDYSFHTIVGAAEVDRMGGRVVVIPLLEGLSTSATLGGK